jgi:uncharacterized protein YtpQ (UPF0354 family)
MWLTAPLRQRAGALSGAAETFLQSGLGPAAHAFRGGHAGLVALCRAIEGFAHRDDIDDETDRRFVEGAGALLGVLLIDHVEGASHAAQGAVHRVRLGAHGFFDPFHAIDCALDAPDIRSELARQVERAEAEAHGRGPLSRLVFSLRAALAEQRPDLEIADQFDVTLRLRQAQSGELLEIDLARAVETTCDQGPAAVASVVHKLLSLLPGAPKAALDFDEIEPRIVPRLARADAVASLSQQGRSVLASRPLTQEIVVALLVEYDGRARYVRTAELERWQLACEAAFALASRNLRDRSERARLVGERSVQGVIFSARTGDGRDSARVLLPELYAELAARIGPEVCIAIPHRDTFLACSGSEEALIQQLARRAAEDAARAPHALSARTFRLTASGLLPLEGAGPSSP